MELIQRLELLIGKKSILDENYDTLVKYFMLPYKKSSTEVPAIGYWAVEQLAAFLHTSLTNPSMKWLVLKPVDKNDEKDSTFMAWIQNVEEIIYDTYSSPETHFNNQIHEFYLELVVFGTAVLYLQEDINSPFGVSYKTIPVKECYIEEDFNGAVDGLVREFTMTVKTLKGKFEVAEKALQDKKDDQLEDVLHGVYKEEGKYISKYLLKSQNLTLLEEQLNYFPYFVARWSKRAGDVYGISPAMLALGEIKKLEQFEKILIKQAHYAIEPSWFLPSADVMHPVDRRPGGINYYRSGAEKAYTMSGGGNIQIGETLLLKKTDSILKYFYIDHIQLDTKNNMTATEVMQRMQQHTKTMSPVTSRIETELLRPLVIKTFFVLSKIGKIEALGKTHQGDIKELKFEYISLLSKGQKFEDLQAMYRVMEAIGVTAQIQPNIIDNVNTDNYIRHVASINNIPLDVLYDVKEVEKIRQERAKLIEQQTQKENV